MKNWTYEKKMKIPKLEGIQNLYNVTSEKTFFTDRRDTNERIL